MIRDQETLLLPQDSARRCVRRCVRAVRLWRNDDDTAQTGRGRT
jgi:hypothetical protein